MGFFARLKEGLKKTRDHVGSKLNDLFSGSGEVDDDFFDEMEELLVTADVGIHTTQKIMSRIKARVKQDKVKEKAAVRALLMQEVKAILDKDVAAFAVKAPTVFLIVGVNGVGKTTAIGKLAHRYKNEEGMNVLIAAGDTFRAAAAEQLQIWGDRAGVKVISHKEGADPGAVVFDAVGAAKTRNTGLLICDTAGRLHNKKNLMNELGKINRIVEREYPEAARECFLVLDATTGQNAIAQAAAFREVVGITGIILTKLDGTAKGGVVITIKDELGVPIRFIGVGEQLADLQEFDSSDFVNALFDTGM